MAQKALRGFKESPKAWEETRDAVLWELTFTVNGMTIWLQQRVTHPSMWLMVTEPVPGDAHQSGIEEASYGELPFLPRSRGKAFGAMGVYVDERMIISELEVMQTMLGASQGTWET